MIKTDNFKVEQEDHIAWLILNRPEKRNTMGVRFFKEIGELCDRFDRDPNVRVVMPRITLNLFLRVIEDAN